MASDLRDIFEDRAAEVKCRPAPSGAGRMHHRSVVVPTGMATADLSADLANNRPRRCDRHH